MDPEDFIPGRPPLLYKLRWFYEISESRRNECGAVPREPQDDWRWDSDETNRLLTREEAGTTAIKRKAGYLDDASVRNLSFKLIEVTGEGADFEVSLTAH